MSMKLGISDYLLSITECLLVLGNFLIPGLLTLSKESKLVGG